MNLVKNFPSPLTFYPYEQQELLKIDLHTQKILHRDVLVRAELDSKETLRTEFCS